MEIRSFDCVGCARLRNLSKELETCVSQFNSTSSTFLPRPSFQNEEIRILRSKHKTASWEEAHGVKQRASFSFSKIAATRHREHMDQTSSESKSH